MLKKSNLSIPTTITRWLKHIRRGKVMTIERTDHCCFQIDLIIWEIDKMLNLGFAQTKGGQAFRVWGSGVLVIRTSLLQNTLPVVRPRRSMRTFVSEHSVYRNTKKTWSPTGKTEKLVELVRERRLLYELSDDYKNPDKKAEAWLEIPREMGTGDGKLKYVLFFICF